MNIEAEKALHKLRVVIIDDFALVKIHACDGIHIFLLLEL